MVWSFEPNNHNLGAIAYSMLKMSRLAIGYGMNFQFSFKIIPKAKHILSFLLVAFPLQTSSLNKFNMLKLILGDRCSATMQKKPFNFEYISEYSIRKKGVVYLGLPFSIFQKPF